MKAINIRRGLNLPLQGEALRTTETVADPDHYSLSPLDFSGLQFRLLVKQGDHVLAGTPLLQDKRDERLTLPSPVSGEVEDIIRGEKRALQEIRIRNDRQYEGLMFTEVNTARSTREGVRDLLLRSGMWSFFRQRPYDIIPLPDAVVRDIYISAFDSSPLAPDYAYILQHDLEHLQAGLDALQLLTEGQVHLSLNADHPNNSIFEPLKNIERHYFRGPHPAGNVGVQIHHTRPINKGEIVFTLNIQDVAAIGKLMRVGRPDFSRVIAITGSEAANLRYVRTWPGAPVRSLVEPKNHGNEIRIISGNVLTGRTTHSNGFLGFYHHQLCLIPEGNYHKFLGWTTPGLRTFSVSRTFLSKILGVRTLKIHTNIQGGPRAFVVSGQYEKVFPFDIYPVYLLKAILAQDIDKMEALGIYEVVPEDFALCDVVCTSKMETQEMVRQGIEMLRKEMS